MKLHGGMLTGTSTIKTALGLPSVFYSKAIVPRGTRANEKAKMPAMKTGPNACPNCQSTRVLRTSNISGTEFFCPHCDHMWSMDQSGTPRVLVVDDEPGIRALANRTLRSAGYEVVTAADGVEGLDVDAHQPQPFDVFLLDVRMPKLTGDELARQLRRRHPDCKVLYFTGFADQLFRSKPTLWKNEAVIEKPASPSALLEAVSMLLYGHTHGPR